MSATLFSHASSPAPVSFPHLPKSTKGAESVLHQRVKLYAVYFGLSMMLLLLLNLLLGGGGRDIASDDVSSGMGGADTTPVHGGAWWRNDSANIALVKAWQQFQPPFSSRYDNVKDTPPFRVDWTVGDDIPIPWKNGYVGRST